jgi:hypothetical protein
MNLKKDCQEALFNLGKLAGRIPSDEARRMDMLLGVVMAYITYLERRDDGDDDSRC